MTPEEVYILKIAEFDLCRGPVSQATKVLAASAHRAGKSGQQVLVLRSHLDELIRRVEQLDSIKWPKSR